MSVQQDTRRQAHIEVLVDVFGKIEEHAATVRDKAERTIAILVGEQPKDSSISTPLKKECEYDGAFGRLDEIAKGLETVLLEIEHALDRL